VLLPISYQVPPTDHTGMVRAGPYSLKDMCSFPSSCRVASADHTNVCVGFYSLRGNWNINLYQIS